MKTNMPMTREDFVKAYWAVQLYGNLFGFLTIFCFSIVAMMTLFWAAPLIIGFGDLLRKHFRNEGVVGLIGGLTFGLMMIPFFLMLTLPLLWVDRLFGVRCDGCQRSVTLRCKRSQVLSTGRCCLCAKMLFEVTQRS